MATINHPGVVDIYDYGSDPKAGAYLVMEYVEGDALSRTLARVGRLTPARTMALVAQAADALHAAHEKGVVHRDVKPGNLLVRPNGTLVLTDFGIARSAGAAQLTAAGSVLGTASYISPEQAIGRAGHPAVRRLRARRGRLPVPGRAPPVRGRQPARDRDAARPRGAAAAAAGHPAAGPGDRRAGHGQGPGGPLADRRRVRRRSPAGPPRELAAAGRPAPGGRRRPTGARSSGPARAGTTAPGHPDAHAARPTGGARHAGRGRRTTPAVPGVPARATGPASRRCPAIVPGAGCQRRSRRPAPGSIVAIIVAVVLVGGLRRARRWRSVQHSQQGKTRRRSADRDPAVRRTVG